MPIYKLQYSSKAAAINALKSRGVINEDGEYLQPYTEEIDGEIVEHNERTHAVVHLGNIQIGLDENDEPILSDKHHVDVMLNFEVDFGDAEVIINSGDPVAHKFG